MRAFGRSTIVGLSLACLALGACARQVPIVAGPVPATVADPLGQTAEFLPGQYRLRANDLISVTVFREPQLSLEQVSVGADGWVSIPLLGPVMAEGLTAQMLEDRIEEAYGERYLREPDVAVNVVEYRSHRVTVEGSVTNPGMYTFQPGTRLSGGISLAAGPTRTADLQEVAVFRDTDDGMTIAKFDYGAVRAGRMADPYLQPGDRVVVGTDNLSVLWQDALRAVPLLGIFTTTAVR